jgi:Uncharacterized protein conserved in bacteria
VAELTWFPLYVLDWTTSPAIAAMLPEQEGAFFRLLVVAWGDGDVEPSLPANAVSLAQLSRLGARWKKLGALVRAQFEERDGRLYNAKLSKVWGEQTEKHAKAVTRALAGVKAKAERKKATEATRSATPSNTTSATPSNTPSSTGGGTPGQQILEGTAPDSTPNGVESQEHVPAAGDAPAPGGAALPAATNGGGDYLQRAGTRELVARLGHRPDDEPVGAPPTLRDIELARDAERERAAEYRDILILGVNLWMDEHPEEAKAIGFTVRAAQGYALKGALPEWQKLDLRDRVFAAIAEKLEYPTLAEWDGQSFGSPTHAGATP